jgi:hypothetical protein
MSKRTSDKITRDPLSTCYVENMVSYLCRTRNISQNEARAFVVDHVQRTVKVPKLRIVNMVAYGKAEIQTITLSNFLRVIQDKIVTPSGSIFKPTYQQQSVVGSKIKKFMKDRKAVKKLQFKAAAEEKFDMASLYKALQNSIKVTLNSLPGGYGFPSSIFYDKGCYNAITSSGRLLISTAFTCCEHFLGGNLPIFSVTEAINLLVVILNKAPSDIAIRGVMEKHNLQWRSAEEVTKYLNDSLKRYSYTSDLFEEPEFIRLLGTFSREKLQFVWYHSNMQHICFDHPDYIKRLIREAFDTSIINTEHINFTTEAYWQMDGNLMIVAAMVLSEELDGASFDDVSKNPLLAKRLMAVYDNLLRLGNTLEDIFKVFMRHDIIAQKVLTRSQMQRESVVVSDTDSVIYTMHLWSKWFTGQDGSVTIDSYRIATLATYWLTDVTADALAKFVISSGGADEGISLIQMKSEYTYPIFLLFELKKVYAALLAIQEGVMFKKLRPDIKGATIRGVTASPMAKRFISDTMVNDIMQPAIEGNVSARTLIQKVVSFEQHVKKDLLAGGLDFIPLTSVRSASHYTNPTSSVHFNLMAWNAIFGRKYDIMHPPDKLPMVKLLEPSDSYFNWLKVEYPDIHDTFKAFIALHGKTPTAMFVNPLWHKIPPELMPLINVREIIYFNVSAIYLTLSSMNINIGFSDKHLMLSDIYHEEVANA